MRLNLRNLYILITLSLILINHFDISAQGLNWFPKSSEYKILKYDLLETQLYSGIFLLSSEKQEFSSAYVPVNLGFTKPLVGWDLSGFTMGLALGVASYTQFEIEQYNKNTLRGGLLNTDFKANGILYANRGRHRIRIQLYHISSHLGDDYMIRNEIFNSNDKSLSYEQLDLIYYYQLNNLGLYFGLGEVISPNAFRKRFMIQGGLEGQIPLKKSFTLTYGTDIKIYEENNYTPAIHSCFGLEFDRNDSRQVNIGVDTYYGHLPYSTLDYGKVFWAGLSTVIFL